MPKIFLLINIVFISLLFSPNKLLSQINPENTKFKHLNVDDGLSDNNVSAILQDKEGFMWLGTADGLNKYDGYKFTIYRHNPSDSNSIGPGSISCIYQDREGLIWIGASGSLTVMNNKTGKFKVYKSNPKDPNSLSNNLIMDIIEDKEGIIWMSTYGGGLNKFDKKTGSFFAYKNDPQNPNSISSDFVENFFEDANGMLWIGTFESSKGGLDSFDKNSGKFTHYLTAALNKSGDACQLIFNILEDSNGTLWIGNGYDSDCGLIAFDKEKKTIIKKFIHDPKDKNSISNNIVRSLFDDSKGHIWAGTLNGLCILDKLTGKFIVFKKDPNNSSSLSNSNITRIYKDNQGLIWICTGGGGVNIYDRNNNNFIVFKNNPKNEKSLINNQVYSIYEDSKGILWMGTGGGGCQSLTKQQENSIFLKEK